MSSHRNIIDAAQSALRDLYGLIPQADRKYANDNLRVLEHALNGYGNALDCIRHMESVLHHGNQYQTHKLAEIEAASE